MGLGKTFWASAAAIVVFFPIHGAKAQSARQIVQQAVNAELAANRDDNSHWKYLKHEAGGNSWIVVETESGAISRRVEENDRPVSDADAKADAAQVQKFIHDPALQAKQRKDGAHDDKSATELLNLLPEAFTWKVESQTAETINLAFTPDSDFHPPDMEARVMGDMKGILVVDKAQHRIKTMRGELSEDVNIGFGILGKLRKAGTFNVERRQLAPGLWQITETHVHIDGKALFFKTIGQQQDEVKTNFTLVPLGTTLEQAVVLLNQPMK